MLKPLPVFYQEYSYYCFQTFKDLLCFFCALLFVGGAKVGTFIFIAKLYNEKNKLIIHKIGDIISKSYSFFEEGRQRYSCYLVPPIIGRSILKFFGLYFAGKLPRRTIRFTSFYR